MIKTFLVLDEKLSKSPHYLFGILGCIAFLFWLFYWVFPPDVKLFTDDADSYIYYGPTRTIGYPVVLSLVKRITGSYEGISFVQLTALSVSIFVAGAFLSRFLGSLSLGMVFTIATLSLGDVIKFCFQIYTESLGLSVLLLLGAACLSYLRTPSNRSLLGIGLLLGLSILLRPSAYALLGSVLVLFLFYAPKFKDGLKYLFAPVVAFLLIGSVVNFYNHGFLSTQSFIGHNLFGKMAFVVSDKVKSDESLELTMIQNMANGMRPFQEDLAQINSLKLYYILSTPLHDKLRFFLLEKKFKPSMPELSAIHDLDNFYKKVALKILSQNSMAYAKDVAIHYTALWFVWDLITGAEKELLTKWIDHLKSTGPFKQIEQDYSLYKFRQKSEIVIMLIRAFLYFCFCLSFVFIARGLWCFFKRKTLAKTWAIGLFFGTSIHFSYFLTSLLQAGYPRYSMFMWPYLFMMFLTFVGICFDYFKKEKMSDKI
jgi:hypothetical protein